MTEYYCGQCEELVFDNGNENGEQIFEDLCVKCKYPWYKEELEK